MASNQACSPHQFSELVSETNISFQRAKFTHALEQGEKALICGQSLNFSHNSRFIRLLNQLNHIYKKLDQLSDVRGRVEETYIQSRDQLGNEHEITMQSRDLYYEVLIKEKNYMEAITIASENIAAAENNSQEGFRKHHYLIQLYSLYGLTGQYKKEAETLLILIDLADTLFGKNDEETRKYVLDLAKNYCRQRALSAFDRWIKKNSLQYRCE
ncbi:MAG: hypothetical protein AB3N28_11115 [Kordiimonas sp.]